MLPVALKLEILGNARLASGHAARFRHCPFSRRHPLPSNSEPLQALAARCGILLPSGGAVLLSAGQAQRRNEGNAGGTGGREDSWGAEEASSHRACATYGEGQRKGGWEGGRGGCERASQRRASQRHGSARACDASVGSCSCGLHRPRVWLRLMPTGLPAPPPLPPRLRWPAAGVRCSGTGSWGT